MDIIDHRVWTSFSSVDIQKGDVIYSVHVEAKRSTPRPSTREKFISVVLKTDQKTKRVRKVPGPKDVREKALELCQDD